MTKETDENEGRVTISPAEGKRVRHEGGELLTKKTPVIWSPYWERRSNDGDITVHVTAEKKD